VYDKYGLKQSVVATLKHSMLQTAKGGPSPWLDDMHISAASIKSREGFATLSKQEQDQVLGWPQHGYMLLQNYFTTTEVATINSEVQMLSEQSAAQRRLDERIIFAIHKSKAIHDIASKPSLMKLLGFTLGKPVRLFQSLNFTHGSKQLAHSDTIHMTTHPLGYMIAVWIALEDIDADSGPLFYYPGSHKLPYVLKEDYTHGGNYFLHGTNDYQKYEKAIATLIERNSFEQKVFLAKAGDAFVWHANILHGGSPIVNPALTRKSMVLHFFAEDVICYHEITERPAIFGGNDAAC
jgi:ectoine hydroxylase